MKKHISTILERFLKNLNIFVGGIIVGFGIYIIISLLNIIFEDISYNFNLLRIAYAWNWQYWVIHLWLYSILMIIVGLFLMIRKFNTGVRIILIGLLCFYLYTAVSEFSTFNLLMFAICGYYYYISYIRGVKSKEIMSLVLKNISWVLLTVTLIYFSQYFAHETHEAIQNYFAM